MTPPRYALLALLGLFGSGAVARAECVDEEARARLAESKRLQRAGTDRDFVKAGRHELTLSGGYYVSDLFDGSYLVSLSYRYHITEDLGVEASAAFTQLRSAAAARVEADRGVTVLPAEDRVLLYFTDIVWTPLHGKAQLFASTILHFDLYGSLGVGLVDNSTSLGVAGRAGLGASIYLTPALALRIDVRDHVYRQQVLQTPQVVQDFTLSLGLSMYLPWRP